MPDMELYAEAYRRGILPEDKKAVFEEVMRRGLVPNMAPPAQAEESVEPEMPPTDEYSEFPMERARSTLQPLAPLAKSAAGAIAPYAPEVGMVAGGAKGPLGMAAGYLMGKQAQPLMESFAKGQPMPPVEEMASQAVKDVPMAGMVGMAPGITGVVLEKTLGLGARVFDSAARRMYEAVAKIPPGSVPKRLRDKAVRIGLEGKYGPTEGGLTSLQADIDLTNKAIAETIAKDPDKMIETRLVLNQLDALKEKYAALPERGKLVVDEIDKAKQRFIDDHGDFFSGKAAQAMKTAIHRYYRPRYGKTNPNWTQEEFQIAEAMAKGLRQGLVDQYPALQALNAKDSAMLELEKSLARAVNRTRNWDLLGLTDILGGMLGGGIDVTTGKESSPWEGAVSGVAITRALRSPHVMSRLSFAMAKAARLMAGPSGLPGWVGGEMTTMGGGKPPVIPKE